jgi:putative transposase
MKKSRFSESKIVAILKEGDAGVPVAEITARAGTSAFKPRAVRASGAGAARRDRCRRLTSRGRLAPSERP